MRLGQNHSLAENAMIDINVSKALKAQPKPIPMQKNITQDGDIDSGDRLDLANPDMRITRKRSIKQEAKNQE